VSAGQGRGPFTVPITDRVSMELTARNSAPGRQRRRDRRAACHRSGATQEPAGRQHTRWSAPRSPQFVL